MSKNIKLTEIDFDKSIQTRADVNLQVVEEYAEAQCENIKFPPVHLFQMEGEKKLWIVDGFHRIEATRKNDFRTIESDITEGNSLADYIKLCLGTNLSHGLRRSNLDKRHAVQIALKQFAEHSDRQISEMAGVSNVMVSQMRAELATPEELANPSPRKTKSGHTRKIKPLKKKTKKAKVKSKSTQAELVQAEEKGQVKSMKEELFDLLDEIKDRAKAAEKLIDKKIFDQRSELEQITTSANMIKEMVKDAEKAEKDAARAAKDAEKEAAKEAKSLASDVKE